MAKDFQYVSDKGAIKGKIIGEGSMLFVAFHGFANSSDYLFPLANEIGDLARIYLLDLPFHGKTVWNSSFYTSKDIIAVSYTHLTLPTKA